MPDIHKPTVSLSRHTTNLSPSTYQAYFHECLHMETFNASLDLSNLNLYNIQLEISDVERRLYRLEIPGLRDDAPRVDLTDVILVRQIVPFPDLARQGAEWYQNPESKSMNIAPGFTGEVHHAVVWGVSRTTETVLLRIDNFLPSWPRCNVIFKVQPARYVRLWDSVSKVYGGSSSPPSGRDSLLTAGGGVQSQNSWMNRMLFPEQEHCISQRELPRGVFPYEWIDSELNGEQMKAIDSVVSRNYGTMPFLISGVPGSGKTKTVVECALQLLKSSENMTHHIIMCAESDPAADTLALRLRHHLQPWELFRLNGPTRSFAEVPSVLMQYTHTENDLFSLPDFKRMMKFKVVVATCR
jgi:helicase MOV-10